MSVQQAWQEFAQAGGYVDAAQPAGNVIALPVPRGAISCALHEVRQRQWLMRVLTSELQLRLPIAVAVDECAGLYYSGWLLRGGLTARVKSGASVGTLARHLCASHCLQQIMPQVDFTRFLLQGEGDSLLIKISLYGGCQLHSPLPGMRRYVPLGHAQARAAPAALQAITDVLLDCHQPE